MNNKNKTLTIQIQQVKYKKENLYSIYINGSACEPVPFDLMVAELGKLFGENHKNSVEIDNTPKKIKLYDTHKTWMGIASPTQKMKIEP